MAQCANEPMHLRLKLWNRQVWTVMESKTKTVRCRKVNWAVAKKKLRRSNLRFEHVFHFVMGSKIPRNYINYCNHL